ncbi:MAG TPA: C40 family peptidase [Flavobacteriaceae bacterium]|nr:C40 family peptidase [Flavobacteriaceae bacterium]
MPYGICNLSIVPLRLDPSDTSELTSQVLYGEHFKILEQRKSWSKIRLSFDEYEGWIDNKQYIEISMDEFTAIEHSKSKLSCNLVEYVQDTNKLLLTIPLGASVHAAEFLNHHFEGSYLVEQQSKNKLIDMALLYLNTPYLWGGKTPFGIDCSGFTQMVYKLCGYTLLRDASQQATQGEALSFIEESEPGDLAFFDNAEGHITHVGLIMKDNYIIHAHGKVRIDRLDHTGIFNVEKRMHTHKLRVIKKII